MSQFSSGQRYFFGLGFGFLAFFLASAASASVEPATGATGAGAEVTEEGGGRVVVCWLFPMFSKNVGMVSRGIKLA